MDDINDVNVNPDNEEIKEIADNYLIDEDAAERVLDIINEYGVDEEEAVELGELGI